MTLEDSMASLNFKAPGTAGSSNLNSHLVSQAALDFLREGEIDSK